MRKKIGFIIISVFIISLAAYGEKKMDKYENWFKEVSLLLSKEEKAEFKKLKTSEEKDKFIELFWAKRDPSPKTEENEFKNEWYKRLNYVNETFTRGLKKGWRSDMGKVYLFFGKPWYTKATPPKRSPEPVGGSQLDLGKQIWIYKQKPELGLNYIFEVCFIDYQWGYDLEDDTPLIIRRALEIYPETIVVNPDLR